MPTIPFHLKHIPWNSMMQKARNGDRHAMEDFCSGAEPVIRSMFKAPVLLHRLGKDGIRSAACLALLDFMLNYRGKTPDAEMPYLLIRVVKDALLNEARKAEIIRKHELLDPFENREDAAGNVTELPLPPASDAEDEPDKDLLRAELQKKVQDALRFLSRREQDCIRALFFEGKSTAEFARVRGCSLQYARKLKRDALARMRVLLQDYMAE